MKRILLVVMVIIIGLISTGCSKPIEPAPPLVNFTSNVNCDDNKYKVSCNGTTITAITILEPQKICGLTYNYTGNELTLSLGNTSYKPSLDVPNNKITLLNEALKEVRTYKNYTVKSCDEISTVYNFNKFVVTCDTAEGNIQKIVCKKESITYNFV